MKFVLIATALYSSVSFSQSTATREVNGWFISPAYDPSSLELKGDEAIIFMKSRFLWGERGEKKSVILKNVKFSCDEESKVCTFEFKNN